MSYGLRLWGDHTGNCIRVAIALYEAALPFELRRVALAHAEQQSTAFRKLNPLGKVPVLEEHGTCGGPRVTTQTHAILLRLAAIAPGTLIPTGAAAASLALERYFFFATDVIAPAHMGFWLTHHDEPQAANKLQDRARTTAMHAEAFVANSPYMAGNTFSLADIAAFTILTSWGGVFPWQRSPALAEWRERLASRPSVAAGNRVFFDDDTVHPQAR